MPQYTPKDIERFWSKVNRTDNPDECWEWQAHTNKDGYGGFRVGGRTKYGGKNLLAHRMAFEIENGIIPDKLQVLHSCDNPRCVNFRHLFLGTQADNIKDMDKKGRRKRIGFKGEDHPRAKLTWIQVRNIRNLYAQGNVSQRKLAIDFHVNASTISDIINYAIWNE